MNIHFTEPRPGEMKMLAEAGFRWVRMDLGWGATERVPGQYDFRPYDSLMEALKPHGIRATAKLLGKPFSRGVLTRYYQ